MDVTLRYCDGLDWHDATPVGWLTEEDAAAADWEGRPYSVVASRGDLPVAVLDIAWQHYYLAVSLADELGRRVSRTVYRRLRGEEMFPVADTDWRFEPDQSQGDPDVWVESLIRRIDGRTRRETRRRGRRGGSGVSAGRADVSGLWRELPEFGEWSGLLGFAVEEVPVVEPADGSRTLGEEFRPWRPPSPLAAPYLNALMSPGATVTWMDEARPVRWEPVGELDMPSGRLVACDPGFCEFEQKAFTVQVAPGRYPVVFAEVEDTDGPRYSPQGAVLLRITDEPVTSWEMALTEGQDVRTLTDGSFFGFGVDSGTACFVDAANLPVFAALAEEDDDLTSALFPGNRLTVPGSDANLIGWSCYFGDGAYPTWIGRDAGGAVVCFAADMLTLQQRRSRDDGED
ncbi:DUF4241 domain-containing protein [Phytomonospora sp. NPDC050363]|uniref:DUF4241 domain-containing protein n=1 Tax=Phytomonospora sp. NPDC050363 TaxID=3155642 RepID=UPI0034069BC9